MADIIQLLPDAIANQIAAGEVVQRPASVVKELVENALDAGATHVTVVVKEAGKQLIQVIDDGGGMSATDARLSFERHATSKIRQAADIYAIKTLGFRGEALASIAAVAQVSMVTRRAEDELATQLDVEASTLKHSGPEAAPIGTRITVKNLFFNIPARRAFLKSNAVELRHINDEFFRIALARPGIAFDFYQHDTEVYHLTAGTLLHRISELYGERYGSQTLRCQEETPHLSIGGFIGKPEAARRTRGEQFFFVNERYIKSSYLNHAVMSAYEALLPEGTFPFYALFLEVDPQHIDVNVHPTKTEIKFSDERTIYAIVRAAVKRSLGTNLVTPSPGGDNFFPILSPTEPPTTTLRGSAVNDYQTMRSADAQTWQSTNRDYWEGNVSADQPMGNPPSGDQEDDAPAITFRSAANDIPPRGGELDYNPGGGELALPLGAPFQVQQRYIVLPVRSGLMLIDQQAAHERILYEQYGQSLRQREGTQEQFPDSRPPAGQHAASVSQQMLFPATMRLSAADMALVGELQDEIRALGFALTLLEPNTLVINGTPVDVKAGTEARVLEGLMEQYKNNQAQLSLDKRENVIRSIAKRMAVRAAQPLSAPEMASLIERLFACANPTYAPDGRKTFHTVTQEHIASFFK
ncbi:MAG: DNA mismatch repair endonuclease MutL [Tunicatimonas sp.]